MLELMSTLTKPLLKLLFLIFFILVFISTLKSPSLAYRLGLPSKLQDSDLYFQDIEKASTNFKTNTEEGPTSYRATTLRRKLTGPGSSPPRCIWKCGRCTPCKPVHVPVPPGNPVTAEYYPEAWRCKCGNKLYMP